MSEIGQLFQACEHACVCTQFVFLKSTHGESHALSLYCSFELAVSYVEIVVRWGDAGTKGMGSLAVNVERSGERGECDIPMER